MKKTIIALMALAGVAAAADTITLGTQIVKDYETDNETVIDLYTDWETYKGDTTVVESVNHKNATTLTFYVKVSDLFGAGALDSATSYTLKTFSYLGWDDDGELGQDETLTVTLGNQSVTATISDAHESGSYDPQNTVTFTGTLNFTTADILKVTLTGGLDAEGDQTNVGIKYIDSPGTNKVLGSASNLNADGTMNYWHEDKNNNANGWHTGLKTDAPIIQLTAKAVPEPTTATLSLLALAGLAARRRRK